MSALTPWNPFRKPDELKEPRLAAWWRRVPGTKRISFRNRVLTKLAAVLALIAIACSLWAAESRSKRASTQSFMRMKLAWSQSVLEGLTLENFDKVSQNAIRMRNMTQSNVWVIMRQPNYMTHTTNFQKRVDALYMAAVDKKLDAATEAYLQVTRSCVECHRLVRVEQRKNAGQPTTPAPDAELKPVLTP